jgi:hypothetical protein
MEPNYDHLTEQALLADIEADNQLADLLLSAPAGVVLSSPSGRRRPAAEPLIIGHESDGSGEGNGGRATRRERQVPDER